jgi:hypothetical protein
VKAITTKYIGPSNTKGSRIAASDGDGNRVVVGYDHSMNSERNHARAAAELCRKKRWNGRLHGGSLLEQGKSGRMVWVWDREVQLEIKGGADTVYFFN